MVAYIDEFKNCFKVGPIRKVLGRSLDCGFLTPRGYRMFKNWSPSRMAAHHCLWSDIGGRCRHLFWTVVAFIVDGNGGGWH